MLFDGAIKEQTKPLKDRRDGCIAEFKVFDESHALLSDDKGEYQVLISETLNKLTAEILSKY